MISVRFTWITCLQAHPLVLILSISISFVACVFAPNLIAVFVGKLASQVISIGVGYLRIVAVFYALLGFIVMFYGFFRGVGAICISIFGGMKKLPEPA